MTPEELTPELIAQINAQIDTLSQFEMCRLKRFAPCGHHFFDSTLPFYERFDKRFRELGGMTPEISKELGWGD